MLPARPTAARLLLPTLLLTVAGAGAQGEGSGWQRRADLPLARFEMGTAAIDGKLYVFGGFAPGLEATRRVDRYDPATDEWSRRADLPAALTHFNPAIDRGTVWIAGGFVDTGSGPATDAVWRYDLAADRYLEGPPLPEARAGGGLVVLDEALHYVGGLRGDRDTDAADHWVLDLRGGDRWRTAAPLPAPRNQFGAVALDGRLYVIGGQFHHDSTLQAPLDQARVDVYDPSTDRWQRGVDLPVSLSHVEPSTFAHDGRVVVVGGRRVSELGSAVWELDPRAGSWRRIGELPDALLAPAARRFGALLVVVGGAFPGFRSQATTWTSTGR